MARNPVENNPVTRFLVGLAVVAGMFVGGAAGGGLFAALSVPYAALVGVLLGSGAVFGAFAVAYSRYDAAVER